MHLLSIRAVNVLHMSIREGWESGVDGSQTRKMVNHELNKSKKFHHAINILIFIIKPHNIEYLNSKHLIKIFFSKKKPSAFIAFSYLCLALIIIKFLCKNIR